MELYGKQQQRHNRYESQLYVFETLDFRMT